MVEEGHELQRGEEEDGNQEQEVRGQEEEVHGLRVEDHGRDTPWFCSVEVPHLQVLDQDR